jgi:hypothetical protein
LPVSVATSRVTMGFCNSWFVCVQRLVESCRGDYNVFYLESEFHKLQRNRHLFCLLAVIKSHDKISCLEKESVNLIGSEPSPKRAAFQSLPGKYWLTGAGDRNAVHVCLALDFFIFLVPPF